MNVVAHSRALVQVFGGSSGLMRGVANRSSWLKAESYSGCNGCSGVVV